MSIKEEIYKGKVFDCYFLALPHEEAMKFILFIPGNNRCISGLNDIINKYLPKDLKFEVDLSKKHDNEDPILFANSNGVCIPISMLSSYGIVARRIEFKKSALLDPEVYKAMVLDGVEEWEPREDDIISIHDEKFDDFKNLRKVLKKIIGVMTSLKGKEVMQRVLTGCYIRKGRLTIIWRMVTRLCVTVMDDACATLIDEIECVPSCMTRSSL